ncbi:MAG TPA: hypothetical protein VGK26_09780 [Thermoanaerobaculia bacterium]
MGSLAAVVVVVLWVAFLQAVRNAGPLFPILAVSSIAAGCLALIAALRGWTWVLGAVTVSMSPLMFYFLWSNGIYRGIGFATVALGVATICLLIGRRLHPP